MVSETVQSVSEGLRVVLGACIGPQVNFTEFERINAFQRLCTGGCTDSEVHGFSGGRSSEML